MPRGGSRRSGLAASAGEKVRRQPKRTSGEAAQIWRFGKALG